MRRVQGSRLERHRDGLQVVSFTNTGIIISVLMIFVVSYLLLGYFVQFLSKHPMEPIIFA